MKQFLHVLAVIELVLGIIGCFVVAYQRGNTIDFVYSGKTYFERDWSMTIGIFIGGLISILIVFGILEGMVAILENQEDIYTQLRTNNNSVSSYMENNPLFNQPKKDEWKCPNCGKINASYVGTCSCGTEKP